MHRRPDTLTKEDSNILKDRLKKPVIYKCITDIGLKTMDNDTLENLLYSLGDHIPRSIYFDDFNMLGEDGVVDVYVKKHKLYIKFMPQLSMDTICMGLRKTYKYSSNSEKKKIWNIINDPFPHMIECTQYIPLYTSNEVKLEFKLMSD